MPANLPPDYYAAERRLRAENDVQEKINILREMLAIMPKHKGTEHLQGDLKRKIAKLSAESQKSKGGSRQSLFDHIPREGAGQAVLAGPPNSGKSTLTDRLTHARPKVADYPFSTFKPVCGMMPYEDIQIQLVDLPPVSEMTESWVYNIIRLADLVLWLVDLSDPATDVQINQIIKHFDQHHIQLVPEGEKRPQGLVAVKTALIVGSKADKVNDGQQWERLLQSVPGTFNAVQLSYQPESVKTFKEKVFEALKIIRIYTKTPGKPVDYTKPYILSEGASVADAANIIHHELAEQMKYARIWGSEKYDGQRVTRDHALSDRDVIEIHT
jgi:ribosome-interacting GTPase 1